MLTQLDKQSKSIAKAGVKAGKRVRGLEFRGPVATISRQASRAGQPRQPSFSIVPVKPAKLRVAEFKPAAKAGDQLSDIFLLFIMVGFALAIVLGLVTVVWQYLLLDADIASQTGQAGQLVASANSGS